MDKANKQLQKMFKDLYLLEKTARDQYSKMLEKLTNERERRVVAKIRNDEIEHMKIAKKLIDLIGDK